MMTLHPHILEKDGRKQFVVLPYDEFVHVQEELADYEDLRMLRQAKHGEKDAPTTTLAELKETLDIQ